MALAAGTRLGAYELVTLIGEGGMGQVYRARDTRLNRIVAIKVLPPRSSAPDGRRERFEREARAISALQHPHICGLYDVGRTDGIDYLVMEYVDGETLEHRLRRKRLTLSEALQIGAEIADAVARAHARGIIHRDLKPSNIMLTRDGAKLLDFGLAKFAERSGPTDGLTTETKALTSEGALLGTFQYMAPEQLERKNADARTDVFAFGVVLYEMITGKRAFDGQSTASLISAIMTATPQPITAVEPLAPASVEHTVRRCLAKDPDRRWQCFDDLAAEMKWASETAAGVSAGSEARSAARRRSLAWPVLAGVLAIAVVAWVLTRYRTRADASRPARMQFELPLAENMSLQPDDTLAVSPSGAHVVFSSRVTQQGTMLVLRPMAEASMRVMAGTLEGGFPFWSPDGREIGFFADGKLKKMNIGGGPVQVLCDTAAYGAGAWSRDHLILFTPGENAGLYLVPAQGGSPKLLTTPDASRGELSHRWPQFLPDSKHYLFVVVNSRPEQSGLYLGVLDSSERKLVVPTGMNATYIPPDLLLFVRDTTLMVQRFDWNAARLYGEAVPVAVNLGTNRTIPLPLFGQFSAASSNVLVYRDEAPLDTRLTWFDREGNQQGVVAAEGHFTNPALSPEDKSVAFGRTDPQTQTRDIWIKSFANGTTSRFTFNGADDLNPTWSPDGTRIAFVSDRAGVRDIYVKAANGTSDERLLLASPNNKHVEDWSPDGRVLVFNSDYDIWEMAPVPGAKPKVLIGGASAQDQARFSPDGRWIAYRSRESGRDELYVQTYPPGRGKWQVSTAGGGEPFWRRDSRELFYMNGEKLMSVDVATRGDDFVSSTPKKLLETGMDPDTRRNRFVATADGHRFLMVTASGNRGAGKLNVLVNWAPDMKE
jgi:eukaryotic-like serine/threonine-protein kinase